MSTDTGENLLDPATPPWRTCSSWCSCAAVIKAVDEYQDLLRILCCHRRQRPPSGRQRGTSGHHLHLPGRRAGSRHLMPSHRSALCRPRQDEDGIGVDVLPKFPQGYHRPQPYLALCLHRQQVRVPYARLRREPEPMQHHPEHRRRQGARGSSPTSWRACAAALIKRTIRDHRRVIFNGNGYAEWEAEA